MNGAKLVVMGIDTGLHSLAIAVLADGRLTHALQRDTPRKARTTDETARWLRIVEGALADTRPHVVGLEDYEPQPWKTGGKVPRGAVACQALVGNVRSACELAGCTVYTQSPAIKRQYDERALDWLIRRSMGGDYVIMQHLRDALAHALYAENAYMRARLR